MTGSGFAGDAARARTVADLAGLLRDLRARSASPLSYRDLAAKTGWSVAALGEYFTGRTLPPADRLDAVATLLGAGPAERAALAAARDRVVEARRPRPAAPAGVPRLLPPDVTGFAGRTTPLADLDALLAAADPPSARTLVISAVSGTAGIGKTALAVHWAHRVADRFPDGQLYVNLRGYDPTGAITPDEALRGFLDALRVPPPRRPAGLDARAALYRTMLAGRRMLILLDNARDAEQVRPLLPGAPACLVLVTSRDQLTSLVAVDGARPLTLDLLPPDEARDLLARRLGPDRVAAEPEAVDEIVTRCARLPLALAIVATRAAGPEWVDLRTLAAELSRTRDALDALTAGGPDVRAVFSWSYRRLSPEAARLFRLVGDHPGPDIAVPAAASLTGRPPTRARRLLAELAAAHLLTEHLPGRYTCHDLLRAYAAERSRRTDAAAHRRAATHRMLDHYLHTAHAAALAINPHRDPLPLAAPARGVTPEIPLDHVAAMAWFTAEHATLLAAVARADAENLPGHTWTLGWSVADYLERQGHWPDQVATGRTALAAAQRLADPIAQAHTHRLLARAYLRLGRYDDGDAHLRHALHLYEQAGVLVGQGHAHHSLAGLYELRGRIPDALHHAQQAVIRYEAAGHRVAQAGALNAVGWFQALLGDHRAALDRCEQALAILQELDDRIGQAHTWDSLGYAHHHLGDHARAIACYDTALGLYRQLADRYFEATTLTHLGDTHLAAGDPDAARTCWQSATDILDALAHPDADAVRAKLTAPIGKES